MGELGVMYGLGSGGMGAPGPPYEITSDRIPPGDVEVCRGDPVHATDGEIGRVRGLAIDPASHHVTHILLEEGHLWGTRRVAIPISAVSKLGDEARLTLTKDQVRALPELDLDGPA